MNIHEPSVTVQVTPLRSTYSAMMRRHNVTVISDSVSTLTSVKAILSTKEPLYTDIIDPQATALAIYSSLFNLQTLSSERRISWVTSKHKWLVRCICECYGCARPLIEVDKDRDFMQVLNWASSSIALQRPADTRSLILKFNLYNTRFVEMLTLFQT